MKKRIRSLIIALLLSLVVGISTQQYRQQQASLNVISWDVFGYYLYLPAAFIYHDPGITDHHWLDAIAKEYNPSPTFYQLVPGKDDKQLNVYTMGLATCYAPGFFLAHAYAHWAGYEADGFSLPYQWALLITSFLFSCLGIFLLRTILLHFFTDRMCSILLVLVVLGTNFLFHAGFEGAMPHNFLFSMNCLIILFTLRWHETKKSKFLLLTTLMLGWATLCRPTEAIWALLPLLWGVSDKKSFLEKRDWLLAHKLHVFLAGVIFFLMLFPQFLYWKWAAGYWREFNNHSEKFSFLSPYTASFLFSFKKGWLVYTPLMVFALMGFYPLFREKRELFYCFLLFFCIHVYVVSSWGCWWYASSFSQRPMVEILPLLAIPLGFFLRFADRLKLWLRLMLFPVICFLLVLNLFQTWQVVNNILDTERMTSAYYWRIFGKTEVSDDDRTLLEHPGASLK